MTPRLCSREHSVPWIFIFCLCTTFHIRNIYSSEKQISMRIQSIRLGVIRRAVHISGAFPYHFQERLEGLAACTYTKNTVSPNAMHRWQRNRYDTCRGTNSDCKTILKELSNWLDFLLTCSMSAVFTTVDMGSRLGKGSLSTKIIRAACGRLL